MIDVKIRKFPVSRGLTGVLATALCLSFLAACQPNAPTPSATSTVSGETSSAGGTIGTGRTDPTGTGGTMIPGETTEAGGSTRPGQTTKPGQTAKPGETTRQQPGQTNATTTAPPTSTLAPDQVEDMKGYTFTIMSIFLPQELSSTSTLFEEQLFDRIDEVEEDYNCKIRIINQPYPDLSTIRQYVVAGSKFADILELDPNTMVSAAESNLLAPWSNAGSIIDPKDARWNASATKIGNYNGKQYGLQFYKPPEVRYCVVMNKTLLKANGINPDDIYTAVRNKEWDFDMLRDLAKRCTSADKNTFGIVGKPDYIARGLMLANNATMVTRANGKVSFSGASTNAINAMQYFYDLVNTDKSVFVDGATLGTSAAWDKVYNLDPINQFLKGNCAFMLYESWVLNQRIKAGAQSANMEYGMIPYPMGPAADNYMTNDCNNRLFTLTASNKDYEKSAKIFNALAYPLDGEDGLDYWEDIQADYFQSGDKDSLDMYKICLDTATFDYGFAVSELANAFNAAMADSVFAHNTSVQGAFSAMNGKYDTAINAIFN